MSALCGLAVVALVAAAYLSTTRDDSLARLRRSGVLRVGYAVEAPFAFVRPDGEVAGESAEMARVVAERLGITNIQWRQVEFDLLIDELRAGRIDVIAAGMHITAERAASVRFSRPTIRVRHALLVGAGNPRNLHSYGDLIADHEARLAVLRGSVERALATQLGFPPDRVVLVPDAKTGLSAVESGAADALALSHPTLQWMIQTRRSPRCELAEPFDQPSTGTGSGPGLAAFAFRTGEHALAEAWDGELIRFLGSDEHIRLIARFGFVPADIP